MNPSVYNINIHYHGDFNNFGQHSAGQGTISNITLQTTECPQSSSDQPETTEGQPSTTQSEDQPAELKSPPEAAREARSEDQPPEPRNSPATNIQKPLPHASESVNLATQAALLLRSWIGQSLHSNDNDGSTLPPARADKPIGDTTSLDRTTRRNIVVFGPATSGKSSIINLLAGSSVANVSGGPVSCTASNKHYYIPHGDDNYTFWDTGLDEAKNDTVLLGYDIPSLLSLVKDHGVNLLVCCIHGSLAEITRVNYDFFWKFLCVERVPIVLVVSGLEGRGNMDKWWQENIMTIKKLKMVFAGHACIASWKGRHGIDEKEFKESAEKVWKLVREHSTPKPWKMTPTWSGQARQTIEAYEKHFKARTMRKLLRELARNLC